MSKSIQPVIAELFSSNVPQGRPIEFAWRLIRRRRRPFLLLPVAAMDVRVSLELYSPQRKRAKIWRALLPLLFRTPAASVFSRIHFQADAGSEIIRFVSEQSGVPVDQLRAPAIKFGGMAHQKSRLVLLACDTTNRPVKVIKLGLDAGGRAATEREADLLDKLPANTLGCIRTTGRLTTSKISAFATAYFPGDSPDDDAGMEMLFHSWINPGPAVPIESLDAWSELEAEVAGADPAAWRVLHAALAGQAVRTTLHHGDFAPWNIRAVNAQNLQAFDWERGHLEGIPGWDWFHFITQTAILARRHSLERVAAEVEELLQSPRFEKYAAVTGISPIVKPLMLAYLLHHRWVVKPLEGRETTAKLHALLAERWGFATPPQGKKTGANQGIQAIAFQPGVWADAGRQLKSAWAQLANVFWEPTLTANVQPSMRVRLLAHWPVAVLGCLWFVAVARFQYSYVTYQMLLPIYALPCFLITWKMGRRWGTLFAVLDAMVGPWVAALKIPDFHHWDLFCWNTVMRFITLQICVFMTDRVHRQKDFLHNLTALNLRPANVAENWAVVLASALLFLLIVALDYFTGPRMLFLPIYLFPAMLITLFLNLRWGIVVVLLSALSASTQEYLDKLDSSLMEVFGWNFTMRFAISFIVIFLLDRLRHENVLFSNGRADHR